MDLRILIEDEDGYTLNSLPFICLKDLTLYNL